mgnify:CR=1 FL=1
MTAFTLIKDGHHSSELELSWVEPIPVEISRAIELPEHIISDHRIVNCTETYSTTGIGQGHMHAANNVGTCLFNEVTFHSTGSFSCAGLVLVFRRQINYYVMSLFVPSTLLVLLSWVGFWIDKESTPGRISLSLLTILTMQNQVSNGYNYPYNSDNSDM